MPAATGRVAVYQYLTGKMPMWKMVDHCYEGTSKTVVDRYHSGNNLGTGQVLFQYYNVYRVLSLRDLLNIYQDWLVTQTHKYTLSYIMKNQPLLYKFLFL